MQNTLTISEGGSVTIRETTVGTASANDVAEPGSWVLLFGGATGLVARAQALATGRPCIAWVDAPSLPHRGMPEWMRGGGYHVVSVYSLDDSKGTVLIGDASDAPIELPLETLTAARGRIKKDKHRLLWIESAVDKANATSDVRALVRDGLRRCAEGLVSHPMDPFYVQVVVSNSARLKYEIISVL